MGPCEVLLSSADKQFIHDFMGLSKSQQCLIVRFINRKSIFVKPTSYTYEEVEDISANFKFLFQQRWFKPLESSKVSTFIEHLTKGEIIQIIDELNETGFTEKPALVYKKSQAKSILVTCILESSKLDAVVSSSVAQSYWQGNFETHISYFLYLYFGNFRSTLNQFSMRDLGVMRTRKEQAQVMARFADIDSAKSAFDLHSLYNELRAQRHPLNRSLILNNLESLPRPIGAKANELDAKVKFLLACELLKEDAIHAIDVLKTINTGVAQEKWAREAYKLGLTDEVETELNRMIDAPLSEDLLAFAEDFLARKYHKKRTSVLTDMLRENSQTLLIDEMHKGAVERGVVAYYEQRECKAYRTENEIWRALFGLYFWHEIYELEGLGLTNEFEHVPSSLKTNQFYELASVHIDMRLNSTDSKAKLIQQLSLSAATYYGQSNIIFRWRKNILERLILLINHSNLDALLSLLKAMTQDWKNLSDGFPDLMLIENERLRFEEVKSEGDQLRRNQLLSIQKLQSLGFDVRITNVNWTIDPMQPYAVVDIETTGGRAQHHRITEVGIVKMIGGEVVAQWQSLINPQRRIPQNITALTGINNNMVADAPLFAEVADAIDEFTNGCVFVAHNVNFDYGFIKEEFTRLERHYRRPKLCTVREMRKYYKGLPSYSLANLTRHFGIDMQRHHRAMSDAIAAGELLNMVNEKRLNNNKS
ncbi:DNA polymerase-3 subunit epsilon [Neptunomonas qingdaonensis]|uniref:DNA-directed DNA polymerase n=2 Tax=Neptunomonas qingdaonensis TaxID=1045558 RepID=A0A1I2NCS4_9GAMM|nr:exonuclease domain-containing protein [Neptunomonas qingdaonensis]SFF99141.1 DNA polymerase-3 subunit epsilon [Neptunomonas qingdaonensis]